MKMTRDEQTGRKKLWHHRRMLYVLCVLIALIPVSSLSAYETEIPFAYDDQFRAEYTDEWPIKNDTEYMYVSEPIGGDKGGTVRISVNIKYGYQTDAIVWYQTDRNAQFREVVKESNESFYDTGLFERPGIQYYVCEIVIGEEVYESGLFMVAYTGLPVVNINTLDGSAVTEKEKKTPARLSITDETGKKTTITASVSGRGNATWTYPKKPYKINLEEKASLLNMLPGKKWALLANYCDKTLLRTAVGFETARVVGMEYVPDSRFVELVLNGEYLGNYQLVETATSGRKRLGITSKGYMLECVHEDELDQGSERFYSEKLKQYLQFKYPDEDVLPIETIMDAQQDIEKLDEILYSSKETAFDETSGYQSVIDLDCWVKWFVAQNIIANTDTNKFLYTKNRNGKLKIGPVWDFEWSLGIGMFYSGPRPNPNHEMVYNLKYFKRMMKDEHCIRRLKEIWTTVYPGLREYLVSYMESVADRLSVSQTMNFIKWPILESQISAGGIPLYTYQNELECDITYLTEHIEWLNKTIMNMTDD